MNRRTLAWVQWGYGLAALAAVVILSVLARSAVYFDVDLAVTKALQRLQSPALDTVALALDWPGYLPQIVILLVVVGVGLFATGHRWEAVVLWLASLVQAGSTTLVKLLVQRPRPEVEGVHVYHPLGDYTYPSGHVFSYIMVFGLLAYFCWRLMKPSGLRSLLIVVLIGLVVVAGPVRIYLGHHWLSDVVAAYLLGSLGLPLIIRLYQWGQGRFFARHASIA